MFELCSLIATTMKRVDMDQKCIFFTGPKVHISHWTRSAYFSPDQKCIDPGHKMADGGAPENDHQQMSSEAGTASIEEKRKSPARDTNYKMANGDAPENDLQQITSEGPRDAMIYTRFRDCGMAKHSGDNSTATVE